jgi:hypothetical protein
MTKKTHAVAGLAAVVSGVMLIGTTGLTFAFGWALWAAGLAVVLAAVPSLGGEGPAGGASGEVDADVESFVIHQAA